MPKQATQSIEYNFRVVREEVVRNGVKTGFFGNYREDTGACLGMTSDDYGVIQNADLVDAAHAALGARGLHEFKERIVVTGKGERMYAEFTFKDDSLEVRKGDVFGYRLTLRNSFDRTMRAAFTLGFMRWTCDNGMSTMEKEFAVTQKHSTKVSTEFVGKALDKALAHGNEALKVFGKLADVAVTDEQGVNILKHFEELDVLSGKVREEIETLWLAPTYEADKARNLYSLYNAATQHLTHKVGGERYEYASGLSNAILFRLVNAARNPDKLAKLVAALAIPPVTIVTP